MEKSWSLSLKYPTQINEVNRMALGNIGKTLFGVLIAVGLGSFCTVNAQDEDDSKDVKAQVFVNSRPRRRSGSSAKYHRSKTSAKDIALSEKDSSLAQIGLTIWRF